MPELRRRGTMAPRRAQLVDYSTWEEIESFKYPAQLEGFITLANVAIGLLVLAWTGIFSGTYMEFLKCEEIWLICAAIVSQILCGFSKETMGQRWKFIVGLWRGIVRTTWIPLMKYGTTWSEIVAVILVVPQFLIFVCVVILVMIFYVCGIIVATITSIWLLAHQYHSRKHGKDKQKHMMMSMNMLHGLCFFQCLIFLYWIFLSFSARKAVKLLSKEHDLGELKGLETYTSRLRNLCKKNPSLAEGMNLINHGVNLMESKDPDEYKEGLMTIVSLIDQQTTYFNKYGDVSLHMLVGLRSNGQSLRTLWPRNFNGRNILMKHILASPSVDLIGKLLYTLGSRGPYDSEMRDHAASIVAHVANIINLEDYPTALSSVLSLLEPFEDYRMLEPFERDLLDTHDLEWQDIITVLPQNNVISSNAYTRLLLQGIKILNGFSLNPQNCMVMGTAEGLISKIIIPITSDLQNFDHTSQELVAESLKLINRLLHASGEKGISLCNQLMSNEQALYNLDRIIKGSSCSVKLQMKAIEIYAKLCIMSNRIDHEFVNTLMKIFMAGSSKDDHNLVLRAKSAGKSLCMICSDEKSSLSFMKEVDNCFIKYLGEVIVDEHNFAATYNADLQRLWKKTQNGLDHESGPSVMELRIQNFYAPYNFCRISAAQILDLLFTCYPKVPCLGSDEHLMRTMASIANKVLRKIVRGEQTQTSIVNIEGQQCQNISSSYHLHCPMLSLCHTIYTLLRRNGYNLDSKFDMFTSAALPMNLKAIIERNRASTTCSLNIMMISCNIVLEMSHQRGRFIKKDLICLIDALAVASKEIGILETWVGSDSHSFGVKGPNLSALVKKAQESVVTYKGAPENAMSPPTSGAP